MKVLVVIDMQNDFTTGVLGNPETAAVTANVVRCIERFCAENPDGLIVATMDTHDESYLDTQEGFFLPVPHCMDGSEGWQLVPAVQAALEAAGNVKVLRKKGFGSLSVPMAIGEAPEEIWMAGVCTDICVISNAMLLKAAYRETPIHIIAEACAGVTPESHRNALSAMQACQMIIDE